MMEQEIIQPKEIEELPEEPIEEKKEEIVE